MGERADFTTGPALHDFISTSKITSILKPATGQDKLVIPSDFPHLEDFNMKDFEVPDQAIMFATKNSVYLLTDIKEQKND